MLEIIESLNNKSTGPSSIPLNLLRIVVDLIVFPLCHIINMSFSNGIFPEKLKIVKVIPLHKITTYALMEITEKEKRVLIAVSLVVV